MNIIDNYAGSVLNKRKSLESWFISSYSINLYRGCSHNCVYCDGRSEGYFVKGEFGEDIEVKLNSKDVLRKELDPKRRRKPMTEGFFLIGGGICDAYEPVELKFELTRQTLELMNEFEHPVHIITKSNNVERDIDLLKEINKNSKAIVSFSFSTVNDNISKIFEPNAPSPSKRLETIRKLRSNGINTGIYLMPIIPFVTDSIQSIKAVFDSAKNAGAEYLVWGGMTLKTGRQQDYFYNKLAEYDESLLTEYSMIYQGDKWGNASSDYYQFLNKLMLEISKYYSIPKRIPFYIYKGILNENNYIGMILQHLDYLVKLYYGKSNYGQAAREIFNLSKPISEMKYSLKQINGVGKESERIIKEILTTGNCNYYNKLL